MQMDSGLLEAVCSCICGNSDCQRKDTSSTSKGSASSELRTMCFVAYSIPTSEEEWRPRNTVLLRTARPKRQRALCFPNVPKFERCVGLLLIA